MRLSLCVVLTLVPLGAEAQAPSARAPSAEIALGGACGRGVCAPDAFCEEGHCVDGEGRLRPARSTDPHHARRRTAAGLAFAGGPMLGASWILNAIASSFAGWSGCLLHSCRSHGPDWETFRFSGYVPLVGPWIQIGLRPQELAWGVFVGLDGVVQALGLACLLASAALRADLPPRVTVLPLASDVLAGLSVAGAF